MLRRLRRLVVLAALAYPLLLLVAILILRYGGQHVWQAELALYAPRAAFALPLPLLVALLLWLRERRALWSQLFAAWLVLFPLMGLHLPGWPRSARDPHKTLRVLSYNGNFAYGGAELLAEQIRALAPDIVLMQQMYASDEFSGLLGPRYTAFGREGEFFIASRFPLRSQWHPPNFQYGDRMRTTRSIRYEVDTHLGRIAIHSFHPASPLYQIAQVRSGGLRRAIMSGALFVPRPEVQFDTGFRARQTRIVAGMAKREKLPVIVAGDTNLPELSAPLADLTGFAELDDGFDEVGSGFGYTFPSSHPWMRIDRIFASKQWRFLDFEVGTMLPSDHRCVVATLELAE